MLAADWLVVHSNAGRGEDTNKHSTGKPGTIYTYTHRAERCPAQSGAACRSGSLGTCRTASPCLQRRPRQPTGGRRGRLGQLPRFQPHPK